MLITTTNDIAGRDMEVLGMVQGSIVQSKHIGSDIGASFKTLVGGEIKSYTEMMEQARSIATDRMKEQAQKLGTDAVVGVRYASSAIMQGAAEVMAYGTAVKLK